VAINGQELMQELEQEPAAGFVVMQHITELISNRLRSSRAALLKTYEKQRGYEESASERSAYRLLV
jgi:hypothetical protein